MMYAYSVSTKRSVVVAVVALAVVMSGHRAHAQPGTVKSYEKISDGTGGFPTGLLDDHDHFGRSVVSLGDLNGDGVGDLAVGAIWDDDGGQRSGAVWILFLDTGGMNIVIGGQKISDTQGGFGGGLDAFDYFGVSVASLGDLDGAGPSVLALAVGARLDDDAGLDRGAVWILFLDTAGMVLSYQKITEGIGGFCDPPKTCLNENYQFGYALASLGDLDGDGVGDLAVGAPFDDEGGTARGAVWILFLNSDGTVHAQQKIADGVGGFTGTLDNNDQFGSAVVSLGDLDGAGPSVLALAVGAIWDADVGLRKGAVWILFLDAAGMVLSQQRIADGVGGFPLGLLDNIDQFGFSVASLEDLNGDGVGDLAVGALFDGDGGPNRGAVWVLFLNPNGTINGFRKISDGTGGFPTGLLDDDDLFGSSVASLGDLNVDGVDDLAVGAVFDDDGGKNRGAVWTLFLDEDDPFQCQLDYAKGERQDYHLDSGVHSNQAIGAQTVFLDVVTIQDAAWLRVYFAEVHLEADSFIRITSLLDQEVQELDANGLAMWNNSSAYFNGNALLVELVAAPGTTKNRFVIDQVAMETAAALPAGICGLCGADDRIPMQPGFGFDWTARLLPAGCTASVWNEESCLVSAGQCMTDNMIIEFRVPSSNPDCSLVHPPVADQFPITSFLFSANGVGDDWAVMKSGVNNVGQKPYARYGSLKPIHPDPPFAARQLDIWGFGIDSQCIRSQTQQRSIGEVGSIFGTYFRHNLDVTFGNAGSGVIYDRQILGIATHGPCPNYATRVDHPDFVAARNQLCAICPWDLDGNGNVGVKDLLILLGNWGPCPKKGDCPADFDNSGDVGVKDLLILLGAWGPCVHEDGIKAPMESGSPLRFDIRKKASRGEKKALGISH